MLALISADPFNSIEGCFWILLGVIPLLLYKRIPLQYKTFSISSSIVLITFGLSDFAQVIYGSFFQPGLEWLYFWKIVNVIGLIVLVIWYLYVRIAKK